MLDPEYFEIFKNNPKNWAFQFSIITTNEEHAKVIEAGCPTPQQRLDAMKRLSDIGIKTILRFRPYILGTSDLTAVDLITKAHNAGATGISCEWFCYETRATEALKARYNLMSKVLGYDLTKFYRACSSEAGYLRLNRKVKLKHAKLVYETGTKLGMDVSFSDPDFKEMGCSGCCCSLTQKDGKFANYCKGQFTNAIIHAKNTGQPLTWDYVAKGAEWMKNVTVGGSGINLAGEHIKIRDNAKAKVTEYQTLFTYLKNLWNNPNSNKSPYKMFHGKIKPLKVDEKGNVVYVYNRTKDDKFFLPQKTVEKIPVVIETETPVKLSPEPLVRDNLDMLFVAINPTPVSAERGHFFSTNNSFWRQLHEAGLTKELIDDTKMLDYNFGILNMVDKPTEKAHEILDEDWQKGKEKLNKIIYKHNPKTVVFVGKEPCKRFFGKKDVEYGYQSEQLVMLPTKFFVMVFPTQPDINNNMKIKTLKELKHA